MSNLAYLLPLAFIYATGVISGESRVALWSCETRHSTLPQCSWRGCYWRSWWQCRKTSPQSPWTNNYEELLNEVAGLSTSNIYVDMLHRHCPWCDEDKLKTALDKLKKNNDESNPFDEVPMCKSITSYAFPKRILNKEGVYKTVAVDPNTKLVTSVRVS